MLRNALLVGRIAGIRIYVHWSLGVTLGLMTWLLAQSVLPSQVPAATDAQRWATGLVSAVALLASLLAHELGHSIVAKRHGVRVGRITLWLLGGISELRDEPTDARADFRIAAAGPLTSFAIGILALTAGFAVGPVSGSLVTTAIVWLGTTNIVLGVFNLLPGSPLDGGRVLRAWLWRRSGDRLAAETAAARSGRNVGLGLILLGAAETLVIGNPGGLWLMLLGWFLRSSANVELTAASTRHRLGNLLVRDIMRPSFEAVQAQVPVQAALDDVIARSTHRVFPVIDELGRPVGVISLTDLLRVPEQDRRSVAIDAVMRALPAAAQARADDSLAAAAARVILRPGLDLIAVIDHGRLVGTVSATDLLRACDRSALGLPIFSSTANHHEFEGPRA